MKIYAFFVLILISIIALLPVEEKYPKSKEIFKMTLEELMDVEVTSVSKYKQKITQAPGSIMVITDQQIRERGYFDLSDLLKDLPGIDIIDNARGFGEFYTIRGIEGNDRFLVLIDGQKINPVSGTFLSIGNSLSIRFARRIEIIFGPASAIYGADAFAGIINIISMEPLKNSAINAYAIYGSQNTIDAGIELFKKISSDLSFSLSTRIFKSDGPDLIDMDTVYSTIRQYPPPLRKEFEQPVNDHNILLKVKFKGINFSWFRQKFDEGNALGLYSNNYIYNKENRWKYVSNILWAEYKKEISKSEILTTHIAYINHVQDPETQFFKTREPYQYDETFSQYLTGKDNTLRLGINYHNKISDHLNIVSGLEYEYTQSIPPYANDQALGSSVKYEGNNTILIDEALTLIENRYAGFFQITYKPVKGINFIGGVRYDHSDRYKGTFNPRIGLITQPFGNTTIKLLYGTAFQAPSLFLQYEQWGSSTAVMLSSDEIRKTEPGWGLKNQKIKTYELCIDHRFNENFRLNISPYYHSLTDLIERVIYTDTAYNKYFSTSNNTIYSLGFRNENIGIQKIKGVNASLYAKLNNSFIGYIHYSYIDAIAEKDGVNTAIPRIAKNKMWIGFTYRDLFGFITVSPRFKWVSTISNRNSDVFPNGKQPGYSTLDISIRANNLINNISFFAYFDNILNNNIEHGGLYDQIFYLPTVHQPGFIFKLGVELQLSK